MPNKAQFEELKNNTTNGWTTINGVNDYKFINKSDSNKYIFLSAGGEYSGMNNGNASYAGAYWSTTIIPSYTSYGRFLNFGSNIISIGDRKRNWGKLIRPIRSPR